VTSLSFDVIFSPIEFLPAALNIISFALNNEEDDGDDDDNVEDDVGDVNDVVGDEDTEDVDTAEDVGDAEDVEDVDDAEEVEEEVAETTGGDAILCLSFEHTPNRKSRWCSRLSTVCSIL